MGLVEDTGESENEGRKCKFLGWGSAGSCREFPRISAVVCGPNGSKSRKKVKMPQKVPQLPDIEQHASKVPPSVHS